MFEREMTDKERKAVSAYLDENDPKQMPFVRLWIPPTVYFKDRVLGFFNEEKLINRLCERCLKQTTDAITKARSFY